MLILQGVTGNWPRSVSQTSIGLPGWHEQKNGSYHAGDHQKNRISPWKKHIQKVIQHKDLGGHSANYPERHPFSAPSVTWIWQLNFQGTISKSNRPTKQPPLTTWYHPIGTGDFLGSENGWTARFFSSSLLMSFFIFLKVLQLFLFCLFQMEKKNNSQLFPNTSGHIPVYNPYNYILYVCIITSSGYMLVIHLRFQGLPHSYQPVRPDKFSYVWGPTEFEKKNIRCCPALFIYFSKRKPPRWFLL